MNRIYLPKINLPVTLLGGQAFTWDNIDGVYYASMQNRIVKIKQEADYLFWQTYPDKDDEEFIRRYFRADDNYEEILNNILKDSFVRTSAQQNPYVRLLKQDFDETLISYMISPTNSIKSIRTRIKLLSKRFGMKYRLDGINFYLFPQTEVIADAKLDDLLKCSLGFRAKRIKAASAIISDKAFKDKIKISPENKSRDILLNFEGIGDKVADCILLYSLAHDKIIPIDRWVQRFLVEYYSLPSNASYDTMRGWIRNKWGKYAGWAGQFLFEYYRNL